MTEKKARTVKLPPLPKSWSELTWQQLCDVWRVKMRYGGNADVARVAALLALTGTSVSADSAEVYDLHSGERVYLLCDKEGREWTVTARLAAHIAKQALPWFDYPYGDPGEPVQKDDKGKVIKDPRDPVRGYVGPLKDAMMLQQETVKIRFRHYALPQVACNNLTWEQYRSLQAIVPLLFRDDISSEQTIELQAQFVAHSLTPRSLALLDTDGGSIRLRLHWEYNYTADQAEKMAGVFKKMMESDARRDMKNATAPYRRGSTSVLFHICFQVYQTAVTYYAQSFPLLFEGAGKQDPLKDALTGEVGTINTIMKYAGYADQKQVYAAKLPYVLDILNTMTKEAKEIEKMNAKIKKK